MDSQQDAEKEFLAGIDLGEQGDLSEALKRFKKSTQLHAQDPRYWMALGHCLLELKHWSEAEKALKTAIELKPHYAEADMRVFLGEALIKLGKKKEAITQWQYVINMEPCYPGFKQPMEEAKKRMEECK